VTDAAPVSGDGSTAPDDAPSPARVRPAKPPPENSVSPDSTPPVETGTIYVDVGGAVKHPNVYQLPPGARLFQALSAAGGVTPEADLDTINRAEKLTDGEKILVPTKAQSAAAARVAAQVESKPTRGGRSHGKSKKKITSGTININTASLEQLEQIPGVGAVTAQSILDERQKIGSFRDSADLMEIDGMTPRKYEKMRPYISIF
jgi:competence protein ComEA